MSKDLALLESEANQVFEIPQPSNPKDELIQKLMNREITLSYSSLKNIDSPVNFLRYFLEQKKKSDSMRLGSLIDCLVLTPESFDKNFSVVASSPTTDLQESICNAVIDKIKSSKDFEITEESVQLVFNDVYSNFYKKGTADSLYHLVSYVIALSSKKEVVSQDLYDKAKTIADNLLEQEDIVSELGAIEEVQKKIEFEFMGWKFKCFLDTFSPELFHDLKFASDCSPDKFEYDVRKFKYDVQFGLYDIALEVTGLGRLPKFKFITYDSNFNYSIIEVDRSYIHYGRKKVEFLINCLNKMIYEGGFNKSYNYFRSKTIIYKPNWAPGFDFEIFEEQE